MPLLASSLFESCAFELNDVDYVRWTQSELAIYLTEAIASVATLKPTLFYSSLAIGLAPGAVQSVPGQYSELIDIVYNISPDGTPGESINQGSFTVARAFGRRSCPPADGYAVQTFSMHPENDKYFYVDPPVPPSPTGYAVQAVVQLAPNVITAPTDAVVMANTTPELYRNALKDWMLYRAFAKDTEDQSSFERSQGHYKAFMSFVGAPPRTKLAEPLANVREKQRATTSQ